MELVFFYVVAFLLVLLDLHFVGIRNYYPSFHRERFPMNAAAHQAIYWALIGPVLWVLQEYVLKQNELWNSYWALDWQIQSLIVAGLAAMALATFVAWHWMLPLWGLAAAVVLYLRFTRPKDSL